MTGSNNIEPGCRHAYKGLRYRLLKPDSQWQDSQVSDELLCIENWQGSGQDALSNIVAFASPPDQPQVVYALTSHSGLLVSDDSGASFKRSPISDQLPDLVIDHRISSPLVISHQTQPDFWIISNNQGLLRFSAGEWRRMAGQGAASCENLPDVDISSLLVTADIIVIGTESHGLWASYDDGQTCRPVFDAGPNSRYDFYGLWNVRTGQPRFLALVRDWNVELDDQQGTWQLLDLCPRPDSCSPTTWQAETNPIWHNGAALWGNPPVSHVLVQQREQTYEWYLVTEAGQVWQGDLEGGELTDLPDIRRCYNPAVVCNLSLAPSEEGATPYLLAANRIYHFEEGPWWHLWWP
jgi:hypothetical protein